MLNLFYEEPEADRWLPFDRHLRRWCRRIVRGSPRVGGQQRVFLNLCAGLEKLGVAFQVNDYRFIEKHPEQLACIVGKPHVLDKISWRNPILFGASVHSHPMEDPDLLKRLPIRKVLVPGAWMRRMWEPYYGDKVASWPVGIDTERWKPILKNGNAEALKVEREDTSSDPRPPSFRRGEKIADDKTTDFLIYDKVRWEHDKYEVGLIQPIRDALKKRGLSLREIRYGFYEEEQFEKQLHRCRAMIFLCEHETQGIAYQQALSVGVPILAWDRGGICRDPFVLGLGVRFGPVSSVPYWDNRCGTKFGKVDEFAPALSEFWHRLQSGDFSPREFIVENLTLEKCARQYVEIVESL